MRLVEKVTAVGQAGERVGSGQVLQFVHHAAQRLLVLLQGAVPLLQALAQLPDITAEDGQPQHETGQHEPFQQGDGQGLGVDLQVLVENDERAIAGQREGRMGQIGDT